MPLAPRQVLPMTVGSPIQQPQSERAGCDTTRSLRMIATAACEAREGMYRSTPSLERTRDMKVKW